MKRAVAVVAAAGLVSCVANPSPQTKYIVPSPIVMTASAPWRGQSLLIDNTNGDIVVQGDPATTTVSVAFTPFGYASNFTDADLAVADVKMTAALIEGDFGTIARCETASATHGTADAAATGCDIVVSVPLGSASMGVPLAVTSRSGAIRVSSIVASGTSLVSIYAANGAISADGVTGSFSAHADSGTVTASVTPTLGSVIAVSSDNGSVSLALPNDFSATTISVQAVNQGSGFATGFSDAEPGGALDPKKIVQTSRAGGGPAASDVVVFARYGNANLVSQ